MGSLNFTEKIKNVVDCDLDPHEYLEIKFLMISVIGTLIGLFGLFGNFSTVIILTQPKMRSPNNMFLTALAIYDSCLLITAFFIYGMEYIIEYFEAINLYIAWLTYLRFAFSLSHISQTGSVYTTLCISVENFLSVRYPKTAKRFSTRKISAFTILGITCFAIFFNSTRFFELEVYENPDCVLDGINWQSYILVPSALARHPLYGQIFSLWVTNIFMIFLPFLTLLILNSIITCTIKKSIKLATKQKKIRIIELREKSREASMMLVIIVLIFLICNFWSFVLTLLEQIVGIKYLMTEYKAFYTFSREIINFLAIINSSINFVIYFVFDKDFRKEMIVVCSTMPFVTKAKIIYWSKKSKDRIFKNQTVVTGILKMTNFARTLTAMNESRRQSTISNKKISIFTGSETGVDASEFQKLVESKTEITKVDDDSGNDSTNSNSDVIYFV